MPKKSVSSDSSDKKNKSELSNEKLIENFVQLQKVNTHLVEKIDKLSNQLSDLLSLFEKAARTFAENPANQHTEKDKEFLGKINTLMDQNKTIAKGLTLMEERMRERISGEEEEEKESNHEEDVTITSPRPLPKF